jgi:hypothetical protein
VKFVNKVVVTLASLALVATFGFGAANAMSISQQGTNVRIETSGVTGPTGATGATGATGKHEAGEKNGLDKADEGDKQDANDPAGDQQGGPDRNTEQDGEFEGDN